MPPSPERKKEYTVVKQFRALNTKANRTAIDQNEFSWLENAMPEGESNLRIVPTASIVVDNNGNAVQPQNNVVQLLSDNINLTDYLVLFEQDGGAQTFNIQGGVGARMAQPGTFANAGATMAQWKNERIIIGDPTNGLFSYDGNVLVAIGSVGFIGLSSPGTGYTSPPAVIISGPDDANGTQAVAEATLLGNTVGSVFLTQPGTGYTNGSNLTVTFNGGGGSGATALGSLISFKTGTVTILVESGGTGITNASQVAITITGGGGSGAKATPIVSNGSISTVVMTNLGQNYSNSANLVVSASGGGLANAVLLGVIQTQPISDVASFSGRIWVAQGRAVTFSAADSYNDFISVSAGNFVITDNTLHGNINSLLPANNFLYIWGDDSINVFSDVQVTSTGATIFTNTNVSASIGTKLINAIFAYFRSVLFMNQYGVYALVGSTTTKVSDPLDGIFPLIDFTQPVTGGQVLINNIICAAFNFYYKDAARGTIPLQAVFFEKKWFLTNQGAVKLITSVPTSGLVKLYGSSGNNLVTLYTDNASPIFSNVQTALSHMGDPIRTKQAIQFAVEATAVNGTSLNVTVDSEIGQGQNYPLSNFVNWSNNGGSIISWANNSNVVLQWINQQNYALYTSDAQQYGKYLGFTATSNSPAFIINTFELEYEFGPRF